MKRLSLALGALALLSVSCQKDEIEITDSSTNSSDIIGAEQAFPDSVPGELVTAYVDGQEVQGKIYQEGNRKVLVTNGDYHTYNYSLTPTRKVFELDEELGTEALKSVGTNRQSRRWPNGKVYYEIDASLPNQGRISGAIANWEQNTSLRFFKRTNQQNYIRFVVGSGCSSAVGMVGGAQSIRLAGGCGTGTVVHEIGHAIGLQHEQTRSDRDNFVNINFSNIQDGKAFNFNTSDPRFNDDYTSTMDFNSIMMYSPYSFAKNRSIPTITLKNGNVYNTQRNGLSPEDIKGINKMYPSGVTNPSPNPTPTPTPTPAPTYENGQFYVIFGVRVYRYNNRWYYWNSNRSSNRFGWNKVRLVNRTWRYE